MAKFTRGLSFSDTAPNNELTAARLHTLIESAEPTTGLITELTEELTVDLASDFLLFWDASANVLRKVHPSSFLSIPSTPAFFRDLRCSNNDASPTTTVTIQIAEVILKNVTNVPKYHSGVVVNVNITLAGAGGLDQGAEAPSTWYYLWLISDGTTVSAVLSTQSSTSGPNMPGAYTYKVLVGAVYNDSASNFIRFKQYGNRVWRQRWASAVLTNATFNNDPTSATGYAALVMPEAVPINAISARGSAGSRSANPARIIIAGDTNGVGSVALWSPDQATGGGVDRLETTTYTSGSFEVPLITTFTLYWKHASSQDRQIFISGFDLQL